MKHQVLLPCSQESSTGPKMWPYESSLHNYTPLFQAFFILGPFNPMNSKCPLPFTFCDQTFLCSTVIFGSESLGTRDHILLSQIWDFPFRRLLRLAGSRWRYSTPSLHGLDSRWYSWCIIRTDPTENTASHNSSVVAWRSYRSGPTDNTVPRGISIDYAAGLTYSIVASLFILP
jgi:hypothetical protein